MAAAWDWEEKQTVLMKSSQDVKAAASELHLCQISHTSNPKRETAAQTDLCLSFVHDESRKLNFLPID